MEPPDPDLNPHPSRRSVRRVIFGAVRLVAVPLILIWILSQLMGPAWKETAVSYPISLVLGLAINQIALGFFAARMQLVLRLFEIRIGWWQALRIHLQSMFYFFALPMTVGLELARFVKIRQIQPSATVGQVSSALILDRLLGAGSALAVAILCLPFVDAKIAILVPGWAWWTLAVGAVLAALILIWPRTRSLLWQAWSLMHGRWIALSGLFVLSIVMHVLFAGGVLLTAHSLGLALTLPETLFAVSGGMLLVALPVSFAGLGPAEVGAAGLLVAVGYPLPVAVTVGALPYLLRLVGAVEGAVWELVESGTATISATRRLMVGRNSS
jgi:uncharacterized membrane protein YbhN (UPF0104 family)